MLASASISMPLMADDNVDKQPLSKGFLSYLAELVEVDGQWVHPTELTQKEQKVPKNGTTDSKNEDEDDKKLKAKDNIMNKNDTKSTDNKLEEK